jgi:adenylate cyclase
MTGSRSRSDPLTELDAAARRRVRVAGLAAALIAAVLVSLAGAGLRQPLFDLFQNVSPSPDVSRRVHVVVIDAESLRSVGGWPWSRFYLGRLVEEISGRGAAAIGLDLLLPEPDRLEPTQFASLYAELPPDVAADIRALPSMDAVLARVIGRSPVVLARAGAEAGSFDALDRAAAPLPPEAQFVGDLPKEVANFPTVVANLPILDGAALGHGLVNGDPDTDGVVRRVPLLARAAGQPTPSFALDLVRVAEQAERIELKATAGRLNTVRVGRHQVPATPDGKLLLRFGDWRTTRTTSAADVLRRGLPADLFKDQIVLVGLTSAGTSDIVNTPRAQEIYGVFVQAQAVDAILRGAGLRRPLWTTLVEWGLGLMLALAAWAWLPRLPMIAVAAAGLGGVAAAFGGSWLSFQSGLLLDPFPALAPAAATSAATVVALFVEGRRVQARLRAALEDERLRAARVAGELAAAGDIQSGMLLPRAALARVCPSVEIDAVLHPARNIGGDLYDAFLLDAERLCFLVGDVTGKGVPAALFMALSKALSHSLLTRPELGLAAAVARINAELSRDNREAMALSLLVGVMQVADGRMELCCAGHENPLVASADGQVRGLALIGGPPLCVDPDFPYPVETERLRPGETLVVFSDGLTEACAPDGRLIPRADVLAAVARASGSATVADAVDELVASVRAFEAGAEPSDDLTILALRLRGA